MNKKIKRTLAVLTIALHVLTFSGPAHAEDINVLNGTIREGSVNNPAGNTLNYNIVDALGNILSNGRAGLSGANFVNAGDIHFGGGDWLLAFQNFVNTGNISAARNLLVTTLGVDAAQFFAGMASLHQNAEGPGRFSNSGTINVNGDWLAIVAGTFSNVGTLSAGGGVVGISAGSKQVTFPLTQDGVISMEVNDSITAEVYDKDGKKVSDVWKNDGTIKGSVVIVKARGAEEAFDNIINHTGVIEAQTIGEKDGKIVLDGGDAGVVRVNGTLDASGRDAGEKGGKVYVLGKKVGLFEKAKIDVSGDAGGGEVLIGGDYQGKGTVRNADFVYMDKGAQIWADALSTGNGGKVILWSNNTTRAYGTISAKGGAVSGNGGFVETSGKEFLDVEGIRINAGAANGSAGKWLLDPRDVEIVTAVTNPGGNSRGSFTGGTWTPSNTANNGQPSQVLASLINTLLNAGTSVIINTAAAAITQAGDISVLAAISKSNGGAASLTLNAAGVITIGATIGATVAGGILNLVLNSGGVITQTAALTITGTTTITAGANNVTLNNSGNDFTGAVSVISANDVLLRDTNAIDLGASTVSGTLGVTANGAITDSGNLTVTGVTTLAAGAGNNITLDNNNNFSTVAITSGNNVTLKDTGAINLGNSAVSGNLGVTAGGLIDFTGAGASTVGGTMGLTTTAGGITDSGAGTLAVTGVSTLAAGAGNNITLDNNNNFSTVAITSGNNVTLKDTNAIDLAASTVSGTLGVTANGAITDSGNLVVTGATTLNAGAANNITLDTAGNDFVGAVSVVSGNDVTIVDTNSLAVGSINAGGTVNLTATSGAITDSNAAANNVTATSLNATAATGIDLDTTVTNLTASNTGAGDINLDESNGANVLSVVANNGNATVTSLTGDLNITKLYSTSTTTATATAGAIRGVTDDGIADVSGATVNLTAGAGGIRGAAAGQALDVTATTALNTTTTADNGAQIIDSIGAAKVGLVNAGTGDVTLHSTTTIDSVTNDNIADIVGSTVNLVSAGAIGGASPVDVAASVALNANSSGNNIRIDSIGNALIGLVTGGATGAVTLNSTGKINSVTDDNTADVVGTTVNLNSAGAIGDTSKVDVTATTALNANSGNNNISIDGIGNLPVGLVNAGTGDVRLSSTGWMREAVVDDVVPVADVVGKNIYLSSLVASPSDAIGVNTSYLDIQVTNTTTGSWNVSVPNSGNIYINCIGDCPIGQVDVGTGNFNFSTSGKLTDANDALFGEFNSATWNIKAGGLNVKTGTGFGTATNAIELRLSDYGGTAGTDGHMAVDGGTGGVFATNASQTGAGLTIGGVAGSFVAGINAQKGIVVDSGSPLTLASNVSSTAGGNITLVALGSSSADNLTVNSGIQVNATGGNGDILLVAGNDVVLKNTSLINASGNGKVTVVSGEDYTDATLNQNGNANGDITMNSSSAVHSQRGDVLIDAARNIKISEVNADSDATGAKGDVKVLARAGRIEDNNGAALNITGNNLILEAKKGIGVDGSNAKDAIEVAVNTLDAVNHTSGHLEVDQVAAGGSLDLLRADQQGAGDIDIRTLDGKLTVVAGLSGGFGVSAKSGAVTLSAQDAGGSGTDDLIVNNTVTSKTGKIHLDSTSRDAVFSADGDVTATGGAEIEVSAQRNVTMASGTVFDANGGDALTGGIDIDAITGNVTLGSVKTTSALSTNLSGNAADAVDINAGGAIIDGNGGTANIVAKGQTTLSAVTGIGSAGAIDTNIKALKLTNTTSGNVNVTENAAGGNLDVIQATQSGAGNLHLYTKDGTLTVLDKALLTGTLGGVSATSGNLRLFSQDQSAVGTSHLVIDNTVTTTSGNINLDSENDVRFSEKGDVTSTSGDIAVDATDSIQMTDTGADGTILNAGTGRIDLDAGGDILLTSVQTSSNASDAVVIVSRTGALIDQGDTDVDIKTGASGGMLISAKTGIGSTTHASPAANQGIETQGGKLAAATQSGDIQIFNTGALDVTTLTDPTATTSLGFSGVGTVAGVTIKDPALLDPNSFIFITSASPMTVSSAITNFDGGNITLYALGAKPGIDTMTLNANVRTEGGNGDVRIVSGSDMTFGAGATVSTAGNGVTSGTGNVILGAGYDATGKAANQASATLVGPGGTAGDTSANLTMTPTSRVTTEDGDILVDAQNNFTVGLLHADGGDQGIDLSDGTRGDVTTFSRNGSTLDADAVGGAVTNDIFAETWNATAGKDIGILGVNPIETNAPVQNLTAGGNIHVVNTGDALLNADSTNGSIQFESSGDILLGHSFAGNGQNSLIAGGSILSQGGNSVRVIAYNDIHLIAGGVVGTASNQIQTQLNLAGNLYLQAGGKQGPLSANIQGNFTRESLQFINTPPGLVFFNGIMAGGATAPLEEGSVSTLYFNPNPVSLPAYGQFSGRYTADFPAFFDQNRFAIAPVTSINTSGIDVLPIEGLGILRPVVPIPGLAVPPTPVPEAERPPLTVPLPGAAKPPVRQITQEKTPAPVYVAPGRGSKAAAHSLVGQQVVLKEPRSEKKKQGNVAPVGMPKLVVPIPASMVPPAQDLRATNHNPPFNVSPIAQQVHAARDQIRKMPSPIKQNEAASAGTGSAPSPTGVGSEAATR